MKLAAHTQILIALVAGVVVGSIIQATLGAEAGDSKLVAIFGFLGKDVFIGLLKMIIVPLIFSSIVSGIAGLGSGEGFGRLGMKTLAYYATTSTVAILIGLGVVNLIKPGLSGGEPNPAVKAFIDKNQAEFASKGEQIAGTVAGVSEDRHPLGVFGSLIERMIPENMFAVASSNGEMLGLISISLIVAFALVHTKGEGRDSVLRFVMGLNDVMIKITGWIMCLAPIGVFGLMAFTISQTGAVFLLSMLKYMVAVLVALGLHLFVALPLVLALIGKVSPIKQFRAMREALLTAFSTASSSATLPVTLRCLQQNAGVSKRTSSFVLPLGATVNMDGTALYECVAVLFVAQVMGAGLDFGGQLMVVVLALATSVGVAGVPSASLVAILIIIQNVAQGEPWGAGAIAAMGAIYAVDRILDMSRTSVNIFSDACGAVVIAKSEGETLFPDKPESRVEVAK